MSKDNLIKLCVKHGDYSVSIKVPKEVFDTKAGILVTALKQGLDSIIKEEIDSPRPIIKEQPKKDIQPARDEFKIRERIPNNIVDIKDLDIKQAVTQQALVRCPHCGQAHVLAVNSGNKVYVMRKFYYTNNTDEFKIIAEFDSSNTKGLFNMSCKPDTDKKAYFEDIQKINTIDDKDFAVTNDTEVFCPVCCQSDKFLNWKKAYESPLEFFETQQLCDVCGGEAITKIVKEQKVNKCEVCGHETSYKGD